MFYVRSMHLIKTASIKQKTNRPILQETLGKHLPFIQCSFSLRLKSMKGNFHQFLFLLTYFNELDSLHYTCDVFYHDSISTIGLEMSWRLDLLYIHIYRNAYNTERLRNCTIWKSINISCQVNLITLDAQIKAHQLARQKYLVNSL